MTTIAVLNYGIGNVKSICSAVEKVGCHALLTHDKSEILKANGLIIPGVGAFSHGMEKLSEYDLISFIQDYAISGKPLMGICLGMQMLFSQSAEFGVTKGLGLIEGNVEKLSHPAGENIKLPHVSWNSLLKHDGISWDGTILDSISELKDMYFVHSYAAAPSNPDHILALTNYRDINFCSSTKKGNIYGCQFHPEKSSIDGLKIISNFIKICQE